jgi:hypothetical protein
MLDYDQANGSDQQHQKAETGSFLNRDYTVTNFSNQLNMAKPGFVLSTLKQKLLSWKRHNAY